jgi:Flp pilus assembly protein TadG
MQRTRRDERGVALAAFILSSAALFALAAVTIDLGPLTTAMTTPR